MEDYPLLKSLPKEYLLPNNNQKKKEHYELYPKNAINEPWNRKKEHYELYPKNAINEPWNRASA